MSDFGCPMYDPQEGKRYDSANGTALSDEKPKFEDVTPQQKAEMERLKQEFLAKISGEPRKKGCAGSAAVLIVATVSAAALIVRRIAGGE